MEIETEATSESTLLCSHSLKLTELGGYLQTWGHRFKWLQDPLSDADEEEKSNSPGVMAKLILILHG